MKQPFDPKGDLIVMPTQVFGPTGMGLARLALDTGATQSLLSWDILVAIGYDPTKEKELVQITTGSGVEFVPRMKVKRVRALGKMRKNFAFLCHNLPPSATVDGLLGLDFLRMRRLVLDFRNGQVSLE
ncbi:MAG: retropepsin-like domain-containing protein [Gemmataceae bacterium]|nr:retropepsin-like domain-containing protein [Gemmataceae bacterium]